MAELTDLTPTDRRRSCCAPAAQETCCEPTEKAACCETSAAGGACGCAAGHDADALRETVRARYAAAALATIEPDRGGRVLRPRRRRSSPTSRPSSSAAASTATSATSCPRTALIASLGCGNPTAMADLHARRDRARPRLRRRHRRPALRPPRRPDRHRLRPRHDRRDARPRPRQPGQGRRRRTSTGSRATSRRSRSPPTRVDVVLSNCVINLSTDKPQVLREAARVLKPGGRFAVSDVIADPDMDDATRADIAAVRRLHRRRAHPRRVHALPRRRRPRPTSRSPRPTASTSTPARRSSAPASRPPDSRGCPACGLGADALRVRGSVTLTV